VRCGKKRSIKTFTNSSEISHLAKAICCTDDVLGRCGVFESSSVLIASPEVSVGGQMDNRRSLCRF